MGILTIQASARSSGNTATLLSSVEEALRAEGHSIARVDLAQLRIGGCRGCFTCAESADEPGCILEDDAHRVFVEMMRADAILFATPLYMWSYAGPLKTLFDRTLCLARGYSTDEHRSFVEGVPAALLVSCGGGVDGNADAIQVLFPRVADYMKLDDRGVWVFPDCTEPERLPDGHPAMARRLAEALVA